MIIIWGSVTTTAKRREALLDVCREHVRRSRAEPGCLSHGAYIDSEDDHRVVFFEQWRDMDAVETHFRVPESAHFVERLRELTTGEPVLELYEARALPER